jgi:GT2 family glycosyltransferase
MSDVDVVIVTYNSAGRIEACLRGLGGLSGIDVIVVDNASSDGTLEVLERSDARVLPQDENRGFAAGCNVGWRAGRAPYVLFLNPDAVIDVDAIACLVDALERGDGIGIAAPRFLYPDGRLALYLRRFPSLATTFGRALLLHHVFPGLDEVVADERAYEREGTHEWVPGACMLVRRSLLELLDGFDEDYFMYCEDKDLCKRAAEAGYAVWYEPRAVCIHEGAASSPRSSLLPVLAASRRRYAAQHSGRLVAGLTWTGLVLEALTRLVVTRGGLRQRAGQARVLASLLRPASRPTPIAGR